MQKFQQLSPNMMVASVEESMAYYSTIFGFTEGPSVPAPGGGLQWGMVMSGSVQLMFQTAASIAEDLPGFNTEKTGGSLSLFIEVEDAAALFRDVEGKVDVFMPLKDTFYGKREFGILDLNGYLVVFASDIK
jgi:lactoylglutathione lyase